MYMTVKKRDNVLTLMVFVPQWRGTMNKETINKYVWSGEGV